MYIIKLMHQPKKVFLILALCSFLSTSGLYSFIENHDQKKVRFWKGHFLKNKSRLYRFYKNGERVRPLVESIFKKYNLPEELYYVGMIESGYYSRAKSRAGARGPWQFMKGTAKRYGLVVNRKRDDRLDIRKATHAAAKYFQDLYAIFGSWELALSAYNQGEYGLIRKLRKANTRNFQVLSQRLPKETRHYIPKMMAMRDLIENPRKYGLNLPTTKRYHRVRAGDNLISIAKNYSLSLEQLKRLNRLKRNTIYIGEKLRVL